MRNTVKYNKSIEVKMKPNKHLKAEIRKLFAAWGAKGGRKSRRVLTLEQARAMAAARWGKRKPRGAK